MAFKSLASLEADTTITLGGTNRKTGKANASSIEGYYLGSREVADQKKKSGKSFIYIFQTPKGNVGVWGKTDMDRKMSQAQTGVMTRITATGTRPTPNGDMYTFKVEVDSDNSIEVAAPSAPSFNSDESFDDEPSYASSKDLDDEDEEQEAVVQELEDRRARTAALLKSRKKA